MLQWCTTYRHGLIVSVIVIFHFLRATNAFVKATHLVPQNQVPALKGTTAVSISQVASPVY
jgi:hypothetical protein